MKKILKWCSLLTKRLYKKVTFVLILVLIPVLILAYGSAAQEDSGMITIALACEGSDPLARQVMDSLLQSTQIIRYVEYQTPEIAEEKVRMGKADAAWIFKDDLQARIAEFALSRSRRNAVVTVLERESTVTVMLTREKLSGALFAACSESMYIGYIRQNVPELDGVSDEKLMEYYDNISLDNQLFEIDNVADADPGEEKAGYLITPVRGLLAVVIVLCGLATAMYYIQDCQKGTFAWVSEKKMVWVELGCQMISVLNVSVVVLIALALLGQTVSPGREFLIVVLYGLTVAVFSMTVRRLCGGLRSLGTLLPLLLVVMIVVCPVFFDLGILRNLQYLFPPTYFINAAVNDAFLWHMPVYCLILALIYFLTGKLLKRKKPQ